MPFLDFDYDTIKVKVSDTISDFLISIYIFLIGIRDKLYDFLSTKLGIISVMFLTFYGYFHNSVEEDGSQNGANLYDLKFE
jgi:hypothetical protein